MSDKDSTSSGEVVEIPGNIQEDEGKWKILLEILENFSGKRIATKKSKARCNT